MRAKSARRFRNIFWLLLLAVPSLSIGQEIQSSSDVSPAELESQEPALEISPQDPSSTSPTPTSIAKEADQPRVAEKKATLKIWNRFIVDLRAVVAGQDPGERQAQAVERITGLHEDLLRSEIWTEPATIRGIEFVLIGVEANVLLALTELDLDPTSDQTLEELAADTAARIQEVLRARAEQRHWPTLIRGAALCLLATVIFVLLMMGIVRLRTRLRQRLTRRLGQRHSQLGGFDLRPYLRNVIRGTVILVSWTLIIPLAYVWLTFMLKRFPFTRPWGHGLGDFLLELITNLTLGALAAIPGLFTVFLIFLITRFLTRLVGAFFLGVENEALHVHWLQPETAKATRRLVIVIMWIFALTVAYPYIPGSSSAAFKGVSVFVGLMVSLGATGMVNQIVSGMVIVYTRAFRPGEYVRIGDTEGFVEEIGVLSTKVSTLRREHITIPNAVLINTSVNNFTRDAAEQGAVISTSVTIGYDTPWRQVHTLLELAASRCSGIRDEPAPRVLQKGLSDFYVEYTLLVNIDDPAQRYVISSDLHGQIQDAFNEHGVQIMSPHYRDKAEEPVVVPKEGWAPPPADSASD
jgi:small-conductance mechanosensitive channel